MTAKTLAIHDIKQDLMEQNKCFLAFQETLNPVMDKLVQEQITLQQSLYGLPTKANSQLIAHCHYCKATGQVIYQNYDKYYK